MINATISILKCPFQYLFVNVNCNCRKKVTLNYFPIQIKINQYSQQVKEINKIPIQLKKSRPRKKTSYIEEKKIEKSGFWNVVAIATAEEYDLKEMYKFFTQHKTYQPTKVFHEICASELDFLHIMNNSKVDNENKEIFIFREGSFVAWNIPDPEIKTILSIVEDFEISKYDENIVNEETEIMPYTYSINSKNSVLHHGNIILTQEESKYPLDKYTYSNAMIFSVKLGIWESLLDKYIESIEPVTMDLKLGNRIKISREEVLKKTGELFALKHSINLSSNLLDLPDFYWEREELEGRFIKTCQYFNIPRRTKVINEKLTHCIELLDILSTHLSDRHHIRLEWMIIILIMVEVGFEILHYVRILFGDQT